MTIDRLLLGLLLLAAPARAGSRKPVPAAESLLRGALALPSRAYRARVRVQVFDGTGRAKAQYRSVGFLPPSSWRVEASAKRGGPLAALNVSDGRMAMTAWPKAGRAWVSPAPPADAEGEFARLISLYDLAASAGGRVAGKAVWRLDLRSKSDGRLRRSLWIGKTRGLLLRREDYRPDGALLRRERATRLEAPPSDAAGFSPAVPSGATASPAPRGAALPRWLPDGFVLETVGPSGAVYSDGLSALTFARGPAAAVEKPYAEVRLRSGRGRFFSAADGVRLAWSDGARSYALTGDWPEADLARMADSLTETP